MLEKSLQNAITFTYCGVENGIVCPETYLRNHYFAHSIATIEIIAQSLDLLGNKSG